MNNLKLGAVGALIGFGIFLVAFALLLALKRAGMPDYFGLLWLVLVLGASGCLAWRGCRPRINGESANGGWGAVLPSAVHRWMMGENDSAGR